MWNQPTTPKEHSKSRGRVLAATGTRPMSPKNSRQRMQCLAQHLHNLGPRALLEFLLELPDRDTVMSRLRDYARVNPDVLRALGGHRFPPKPLRIVA